MRQETAGWQLAVCFDQKPLPAEKLDKFAGHRHEKWSMMWGNDGEMEKWPVRGRSDQKQFLGQHSCVFRVPLKLISHRCQQHTFKWPLPMKSLYKCAFRTSAFRTLAFMRCYTSFFVFGLHAQNAQPLKFKAGQTLTYEGVGFCCNF